MNATGSGTSQRGAVSRLMVLCVAGWSIAIVLMCWAGPKAYRRLMAKIPSVRAEAWAQNLDRRKAQLGATTWKDERPLNIFAGDSHVEFGNWYELCAGKNAIRNCGLSASKIEDVATLVAAVPDRKVDTVVLMCGINNLGTGESVASCAERYANLLTVTANWLKPQRIVVLSVMPVRQPEGDGHGRKLNQNVSALNEKLKDLCREKKAIFANVNGAITNAQGSLAAELTVDGLHLNAEGYRAIGSVVCELLNPAQHPP